MGSTVEITDTTLPSAWQREDTTSDHLSGISGTVFDHPDEAVHHANFQPKGQTYLSSGAPDYTGISSYDDLELHPTPLFGETAPLNIGQLPYGLVNDQPWWWNTPRGSSSRLSKGIPVPDVLPYPELPRATVEEDRHAQDLLPLNRHAIFTPKQSDPAFSPAQPSASSNLRHAREQPREAKRRYRCDICAYQSSYPKDLLRHQRTHSGEREFSCAECGRSFARRDNLNRHIGTEACSRRRNELFGDAESNRPERRSQPPPSHIAATAIAIKLEDLLPEVLPSVELDNALPIAKPETTTHGTSGEAAQGSFNQGSCHGKGTGSSQAHAGGVWNHGSPSRGRSSGSKRSRDESSDNEGQARKRQASISRPSKPSEGWECFPFICSLEHINRRPGPFPDFNRLIRHLRSHRLFPCSTCLSVFNTVEESKLVDGHTCNESWMHRDQWDKYRQLEVNCTTHWPRRPPARAIQRTGTVSVSRATSIVAIDPSSAYRRPASFHHTGESLAGIPRPSQHDHSSASTMLSMHHPSIASPPTHHPIGSVSPSGQAARLLLTPNSVGTQSNPTEQRENHATRLDSPMLSRQPDNALLLSMNFSSDNLGATSAGQQVSPPDLMNNGTRSTHDINGISGTVSTSNQSGVLSAASLVSSSENLAGSMQALDNDTPPDSGNTFSGNSSGDQSSAMGGLSAGAEGELDIDVPVMTDVEWDELFANSSNMESVLPDPSLVSGPEPELAQQPPHRAENNSGSDDLLSRPQSTLIYEMLEDLVSAHNRRTSDEGRAPRTQLRDAQTTIAILWQLLASLKSPEALEGRPLHRQMVQFTDSQGCPATLHELLAFVDELLEALLGMAVVCSENPASRLPEKEEERCRLLRSVLRTAF